jgi:hypothetical protein
VLMLTCMYQKARITKLAVQSCLGIGETWLTDALVSAWPG